MCTIFIETRGSSFRNLAAMLHANFIPPALALDHTNAVLQRFATMSPACDTIGSQVRRELPKSPIGMGRRQLDLLKVLPSSGAPP